MRRKRTYTQRRANVRRIKRGRTRGKGLPYIYNNKVYLGKKPQKVSEAISKILSSLIPIVRQAVKEIGI